MAYFARPVGAIGSHHRGLLLSLYLHFLHLSWTSGERHLSCTKTSSVRIARICVTALRHLRANTALKYTPPKQRIYLGLVREKSEGLHEAVVSFVYDIATAKVLHAFHVGGCA